MQQDHGNMLLNQFMDILGLVQGHLSETFGQFNSFNFGPDVSKRKKRL